VARIWGHSPSSVSGNLVSQPQVPKVPAQLSTPSFATDRHASLSEPAMRGGRNCAIRLHPNCTSSARYRLVTLMVDCMCRQLWRNAEIPLLFRYGCMYVHYFGCSRGRSKSTPGTSAAACGPRQVSQRTTNIGAIAR
jgi:hypothetical protein